MAAEAIADPLFLDTSLIIAATVEAHPAHKAASGFVDARVAEARPMFISLQVCREFLVVLTRQPVSGRVCLRWRNRSRRSECLRLVKQFDVHGKQVHNCNIVATMLAHGVPHLATRNAADFKRYEGLISIDAVTD
jgi:predicted nucleic acid-binding protein